LIAEKTYYYKLRHKNARGDLSDYSSVENAASLAEASDNNTLSIKCQCGDRKLNINTAYYKIGDSLIIDVTSQLPLTAEPVVTIDNYNIGVADSSTTDYLSNIYLPLPIADFQRSSTAQSVNNPAKTVTLDVGASAVNDFYKDMVLVMDNEQHRITAYNGDTKVATVEGSPAWGAGTYQIYLYHQGTVILKATATVKQGGTSIQTEVDIMLDFIAPTVTGTPIIIDTKNNDQIPENVPYAYKAEMIWIFITDDVSDTSGDSSEAAGLNKVYLQNAFVGLSTSTPGDTLVDSVLANIFDDDYWNDYYLTDSGGMVYQILNYIGATGTFELDDTCDDGVYYVTKYDPTDTAHYSDWKNYDVQNYQVFNWNLTIEMPYNKDEIPDTGQPGNGGSVGGEDAYLDTDHKYKVVARFTDNAENFSNICSDDIYLDKTPPSSPTEFTAKGMLESILLTWQNPADLDLDKINIYMRDREGICSGGIPTNYDKTIYIPNAIPDKYMEYTIYFQEPDPQHKYFILTAMDKAGNESICSSEEDAISFGHWGKIFRNWLDNSSFERTVPSDANLPVSLLKSGSPTVETSSQYGSNSILVDQNDYYYYDYMWLPASPDTYFFTFSVYARYDTNCQAKIEIKFYDSNGDQTGSTITLLTGNELGDSLTDTFVRYHAHFGVEGNTIPSDTTSAKIYFKSDSDTNKAYYDAVQWEQVTAIDSDPTDYVEGRVISGDRMMAHFIRGDHIEFDTMIGNHFKAVSIQTSKLEIASGENLVPNSAFESDFAYWTYDADFSLSDTRIVYGKQCAKLVLASAEGYLKSDYCPIKQDADYCISFYYYLDALGDDLYFKLEQYDKAHVIGTTTTMKSSNFTEDAWTRFEYQMTVFDADAAYVKIYILCEEDGLATTGYFDAFQIEQIASATQGASDYKGKTRIVGEEITAGKIQSADEKTYFDLDNSVIVLDHPTADVKTVLKSDYLAKTFDGTNYHKYPVVIVATTTAEADGSLEYSLWWNAGATDVFNLGSRAEYMNLYIVSVLEKETGWDVYQNYKALANDIKMHQSVELDGVAITAAAGTFTNNADIRIVFLSSITW